MTQITQPSSEPPLDASVESAEHSPVPVRADPEEPEERTAVPPARRVYDRAGRDRPGFFIRFAHRISAVVGSPWAFITAMALVVAWAVSGPLFGFSATWQLVINTSTTIVTFLMVFLIQNTQNRDSRALHLKLDAIIDAFDQIREDMVDIEDASDEELEEARREFEVRRRAAEGRR